jgi:cyclomaltodextrinase / maltogenic alpha-amylase / neopullulanase
MSVPDWIHEAIFYQIFPDRFFNGDAENDPPNLQPWGSAPTSWGFQGGDLKGILQKFDYLLDLGVNAIYLNPIFQASSNHRYNTTNYYQIDPKLGTQADFQALIDHAHKNNVRIILDGVFNHCGRGFFAFNDLLENQEHSPYRQWYYIKHFPINAYSVGEASDYLGWWGMKSLPKFNTNNQKVRKYLFDVARYWIDQGADGWRLDVPNEINDDSFWDEFRQVVKSANPEAYLVGEIWSADPRWVGEGHFDGLMDYPVMDAVTGLLGSNTLDVAHFAEKVEGLLDTYPRENAYAMYLALASHDTERILTRLGNNLEKTRLAYLFQFSYPGIPAIYYGDEIGLTGEKDPGCRGAFPWDESNWNKELRAYIKKLIQSRLGHSSLRRGDFIKVRKDANPACYAFLRKSADDQVLVVMNASANEQRVAFQSDEIGWKEGQVVTDLLDRSKTYTLQNNRLEISLRSWGGCWLA